MKKDLVQKSIETCFILKKYVNKIHRVTKSNLHQKKISSYFRENLTTKET